MKSIVLLGSTGSLGSQVFDMIVKYPKRFKIIGLACNQSIEILKRQILKCGAEYKAVYDLNKAKELAETLKQPVFSGKQGIQKLSFLDKVDLVINCISGKAGVICSLSALRNGKNLILANKESLVLKGESIINLVENKKITLMPLDSEHTSIMQILQKYKKQKIKKIILPASGGLFWDKNKSELANITPEQTLNHPVWGRMGRKITVESSLMINKGLEMIEAKYIYGLKSKQIEVIIHPEAKLHAVVCFDRICAGLISENNMSESIKYALGLPNRVNIISAPNPEDIYKSLPQCRFIKPDLKEHKGLSLAYKAMKKGQKYEVLYCSEAEKAVNDFFSGKIKYLDIYKKIEQKLKS